MNRAKLKLSDLNPHLMCVLCGGYYIDATTIVECLHSFCRSCIVKHLESSKYCPICEVQVHKTKPLINIRPDKTLQDIVYKLVPGLFANEMRKRRKFYRERPHYTKPNDSESVGEISDEKRIYVHDENITLSLDYHKSRKQGGMENSFQEITALVKSEKRYFKCPAGVTIHHLQKLVKAKYDLNDSNYKVEIFFKDQLLHEDFTLLDVWYIYLWKSKGSLDLTFKIYENIIKRQKIEEVKEETLTVEQKEVDVRLNSIEPPEKKIEVESEAAITVKTEEETIEKPVEKPPEVEPSQEQRLEPPIEIKSDKDETPSSSVDLVSAKAESTTNEVSTTESIKENGVDNKESKEVQLQISESGVMSISQIENGEVVRTVEESSPKIIDNYRNKSNATAVPGKLTKPNAEVTKQHDRANRLIPEQSKQAPKPAKPYKTIRCSPKSWNPVIPKEKLRPTLMKNSDEPKKPLKFFKMRNMPRFLGNPASGVKPMFADSTENDTTERRSEEKKALKNILKIDPKTLRPIEKEEIPIISTPSTPNLLTNPFIPNNNHFLFSDPTLIHPNAGNYSSFGKSEKNNNNNNNNNNHNNNGNSFNNNSSSSGSNNSNNSSNGKPSGSSRPPIQNGTFPPLCFPTTEYCSNFFPYQTNFPKHANLYPPNDKLDPLMRASRLAPFANLPAFNMAGFHASLPPSISLLLKHQSPHHHFKKANPFQDKKNCSKDESTKETSKNCDDISLRVAIGNDRKEDIVKEEKKVSSSMDGERTVGERGEKEKEERKSVELRKEKSVEPKREKSVEPKREKSVEPKKEKTVETKKEKTVEPKKEKTVEPKKEKTVEPKKEKTVEPKKEKTVEPKKEKSEEGKEAEKERKETNKESNNDNSKEIDEVVSKTTEESTCLDVTSACNVEAKPETVGDNESKSVNDKER